MEGSAKQQELRATAHIASIDTEGNKRLCSVYLLHSYSVASYPWGMVPSIVARSSSQLT